eukprot:13776435-Ditylum_brightwellii.AAC.1
MYTEEKAIWAAETTKDNLQQAMKEINLDFKGFQTVLPDEFFTNNSAFPVPCIIPSHGVSQNHADKTVYNVADNLEQMEETYNHLPKGAWSRGPLTRSYLTKITESTKTKPTSLLQQTNAIETYVKDKYDKIKKSMGDFKKKHTKNMKSN